MSTTPPTIPDNITSSSLHGQRTLVEPVRSKSPHPSLIKTQQEFVGAADASANALATYLSQQLELQNASHLIAAVQTATSHRRRNAQHTVQLGILHRDATKNS